MSVFRLPHRFPPRRCPATVPCFGRTSLYIHLRAVLDSDDMIFLIYSFFHDLFDDSPASENLHCSDSAIDDSWRVPESYDCSDSAIDDLRLESSDESMYNSMSLSSFAAFLSYSSCRTLSIIRHDARYDPLGLEIFLKVLQFSKAAVTRIFFGLSKVWRDRRGYWWRHVNTSLDM